MYKPRRLLRAALALLACASAPAMAAVVTIAGSSGTVDNDDEGIYYTSGSSVGVLTAAPNPSTVNVYYNVPQLSGFSGARSVRWTIRYREDTGARLLMNLRRYDLETGVTTTVDTFDSDNYADTDGTPRTDDRCVPVTWDFGLGVYYVDAALTRPDDSNVAVLYGFALESLAACP
jgi:hypothetical protein